MRFGRVTRATLVAHVVALATALTTAAIAAASCDDHELGYCNSLVNAGSWCTNGDRHSYMTNAAHYDGGGTVYVCERMLGDLSGATYSHNCANNAAFANIGSNCDTLIDVYVGNFSSNSHTIRGSASY